MSGRVSVGSSDSVSSYVSADDSSDASVYHDASDSVSRRNSEASAYYDAASSVSGLDVGNLSDLEAFEPSKVAKLFSFVFPKISCFKQAYAEPRNEGIAEEWAKTERWNKQIEATIEELRKQPKMQALPLNVHAESPPSLHVSVPAAISEEAHGGGEANELPPQGHDVVAIKDPFNAVSFPHFRAEITLVRDTLDKTNLSVDEKIATLITLKKKTGIFSGTVKMMNLAEIMRDTARHESYEAVDRNPEKEKKLQLDKIAVERSELELANCQKTYKERKGLLDALLGLQQPFDRRRLEDLHERYLRVSGDKRLDTTFEKFVEALYDEQNQYLKALNDLVTESRNKIIEALERRDKVEANCTSEFEYNWFTSSNSREVFTNTFMYSYKQFNGSWDNTYFGDLSHWISDQLKDKSQKLVKRFGVIVLQVASVGLYIIAKLAQTVGAPIAAFLASSSAVAFHVIFRLVRFFTYKPYKWLRREFKIDAPKDEEQINKTRIADPARKLNITRHLLDNPITSAVAQVAKGEIGVRNGGISKKRYRRATSQIQIGAHSLSEAGSASILRDAPRYDSVATSASALASAALTRGLSPQVNRSSTEESSEAAEYCWEDSRRQAFIETEKKYAQVRQERKPRQDSSGLGSSGSVITQRLTQSHNSALTKGMTTEESLKSYENLRLQSGGAAVAASQGSSWRTKIHDFVTGHSSSNTFSYPQVYTVKECDKLIQGMRRTKDCP